MKKNKLQSRPRNKPRNLILVKSPAQRVVLDNFWLAGGHCLAVNKISEKNIFKAKQITDCKQQWSILVLMCCIDTETGSNCYTSSIKTVTRYIDQPALQVEIDSALHELYQEEKEAGGSKIISPAFFAVPSLAVDLETMTSDIVKRFEGWGAFDNDICGVSYTLREDIYA